MFIRELLALYVYNYFEMINPTCSFSLPLSFGTLKYVDKTFITVGMDSNACVSVLISFLFCFYLTGHLLPGKPPLPGALPSFPPPPK